MKAKPVPVKEPSPLTPEMRRFIIYAVVPCLVKSWKRKQGERRR